MQLFAPLILLLIGMGTSSLWRTWGRRPELLWMGLGLISLGLGLLVQVLRWPTVFLHFVLAFSLCYVVGAAAMAKALALRFKVAMPQRAALCLGLILLAMQVWFTEVAPNREVRVYGLTTGVMLLMGLPLVHWKSMRIHSRLDQLLRWFYPACIALNVLRALLLLPSAYGVSQELFVQSGYWISIHFTALLLTPLVAGLLVLAVVHEAVHALQHERNHDPLTHLLNRRGFIEGMQQLRRRQQQGPYALLLCDLDHFKRINDQWGHSAGDCVLCAAAQLLQQQVGSHGLIARHGGEEFAVLLCGTDVWQAQRVAERLRHQLAQMPMQPFTSQRVTLSIGVAALRALTPEALKQAFSQADALLYRAKRSGRNQVVAARMVPRAHLSRMPPPGHHA